ncbi:MAG: metallophosphoesterase [Trueperaceae bacterium]
MAVATVATVLTAPAVRTIPRTSRLRRRGPRVFPAILLMMVSLATAWAEGPFDPPRGDARIVVFGDFNGPYGALDYASGVASVVRSVRDVWRPDLFLSPGDVIAGQSRSLPDDAFAAMWSAFDATVTAPLREAGIPHAFAMGNHDASSLRAPTGGFEFARERAAAERYWRQATLPLQQAYLDRSRFPFDYAFVQAFDGGDLFVAVIDASSATVDEGQRSWLQAVLEHPAAVAARYRIVVGHLPLAPVAVGRDRSGEYLADAETLRSVMEAGGVDLVVSGHHAAYYFGRLGDLEMLFAGGVGGRKLLGHDAPARSTVSVLDLWFATGALQVTTFDLVDMQVVPLETLPPSIGMVVRRDQAPLRAQGTAASNEAPRRPQALQVP